MKTILHLNSSIFGDGGQSSRLAKDFVARFPGARVILTGKKAYVFAARGGLYAGTPKDTQTAFVRDFLAFLGITDVKFVYAEGLALGEASKTQSLAAARNALRALVQPETIAA